MPSKTQHLALLTLTLLTTCSTLIAATHHHAAAPGPAADCNSLVLNMADCLSFVSDGSTDKKPAKTCCSGLKTVLETAPECLCEAFKSSAQMGVTLNVTKALTLPAVCGLKAPSGSNCGLSVAVTPVAAPVDFTPSPFGGIAPSSGFNVETPVPAPSPGSSGTQDLSAPVVSLVIGFAVASFASF